MRSSYGMSNLQYCSPGFIAWNTSLSNSNRYERMRNTAIMNAVPMMTTMTVLWRRWWWALITSSSSPTMIHGRTPPMMMMMMMMMMRERTKSRTSSVLEHSPLRRYRY